MGNGKCWTIVQQGELKERHKAFNVAAKQPFKDAIYFNLIDI